MMVLEWLVTGSFPRSNQIVRFTASLSKNR